MPCCGRASWKDDALPGHQFKDVDVDDFVDRSCLTRLRYGWVFLVTLKAVLIYIADLAITVLMFAILASSTPGECNTGASLGIGLTFRCSTKSSDSAIYVWRPYIILASVLFSFLLLFLDWRKALGIIKSGYIAEALTSSIASRYYVLRSYPHFCFFQKLKQSRKMKDQLTFFVFFMLRGWKKLMFAELPRTFINAWTIKDILTTAQLTSVDKITGLTSLDAYLTAYRTLFTSDLAVAATLALQTFTVLMWAISFTGIVIAFVIYIPLLCEIRGNLKEYCVRKVDKR
ncbi:hypothetical protein BJ742DRAFT_680419 [Cladochytrium replicatum]|nr:hypothetical protein BJ742DRAFT_680419 [Cladochytrium replicatum]